MGTELFPGMLPSTTELSGDSSSLYSDGSLMPETELALVVADDSADACCCVVLEVVFDSRLWRLSSWVLGAPLALKLSDPWVSLFDW